MSSIIKQKSNQRGFTLIEMLIAIFIFTVSIAALTLMAGRGINSVNDAQRRITADFLAIEGIEVVRNIRDTAFLAGLPETSWTGVFGGNISGPGGCFNAAGDSNQNKVCKFTYGSGGIPELSSCTETCPVFQHPVDRYYTQDTGTATPYNRQIFINEINQSEIKVRVRVEWGNEFIEYQENLLLWG